MQSLSGTKKQPANSVSKRASVARGRPPTLSAERVIDAARGLLRHKPADDISLAAVARALNCTTVALYHYFPSRDALFEAVASAIFQDFPVQNLSGARWQQNLFDWCMTLKRFFEQDQAVTRAMAWDGRVSGPWLRAQGPVFELLYDLGLRGSALIETLTWFSGAMIGLLRTHVMGWEMASSTHAFDLNTDEALAYLSDRQKTIILECYAARDDVDSNRMLDNAFIALISALDRIVKESGNTALSQSQATVRPSPDRAAGI